MTNHILAMALCLGFLSSTSRAGITTVFTAGTEDGFALPTEPASASSNALATAGTTASSNFDLQEANFNVIHTFGSLPSNIVQATLRLRVKGHSNSNAGNSGDGLILFFSDSAPNDLAEDLAWSRTFGATTNNGSFFTDNDPGLLTIGTWSDQSDKSITLDLAALPLAGGGTLNLLPQLNSAQFLDVLSGDDSTTDFFELTVTAVPEPSAAILLFAGWLLLPRPPRNF